MDKINCKEENQHNTTPTRWKEGMALGKDIIVFRFIIEYSSLRDFGR
jgi:hypothetical protein